MNPSTQQPINNSSIPVNNNQNKKPNYVPPAPKPVAYRYQPHPRLQPLMDHINPEEPVHLQNRYPEQLVYNLKRPRPLGNDVFLNSVHNQNQQLLPVKLQKFVHQDQPQPTPVDRSNINSSTSYYNLQNQQQLPIGNNGNFSTYCNNLQNQQQLPATSSNNLQKQEVGNNAILSTLSGNLSNHLQLPINLQNQQQPPVTNNVSPSTPSNIMQNQLQPPITNNVISSVLSTQQQTPNSNVILPPSQTQLYTNCLSQQQPFDVAIQMTKHCLGELIQLLNSGQLNVDHNMLPYLVNVLSKKKEYLIEILCWLQKIEKNCSHNCLESLRTLLQKKFESLRGQLNVGMKQTTSQVDAQDSRGTPTMEESCISEDKLEEVDAIISAIVGLEGVKFQLRTLVKGVVLHEKRKTLGFDVGPRKTLHMAFLGNPGTGKTMVARILGKIFHKLGLISTHKVTEVHRTDLVGQYIGHTGPKTRKKIEEAKGGILFVDEAYRLIPDNMSRDFGIEALEEIMSAMDNGNIVVIFAGYSQHMERVISANEGFSRRVSRTFYFDDYIPRDIALILQSKINTQDKKSFHSGFKLHPDCTVEAMAHLIKENITEEFLKKMNGGLVDPLLVNALENLDRRSNMADSDETLVTITMEDLENGLKSLSNSIKKSHSFEHLYI